MQDFEIANSVKLKNLKDVISKYDIDLQDVDFYGKYKAKIDVKKYKNYSQKGKLILVTATTPTKAGEGKTTVSVGLNDALNKLGKKSILALREPSLGPVFGFKGGACGGGHAQLAPMIDINLNFTGDFAAITAANNLISAHIDNNFWFGNELNLDPENITWLRCLDANDRALRDITINTSRYTRKEKFEITPASEIMAIFCLSKNIFDLKQRLNRIVIGLTFDGEVVHVSDLKIVDALVALLSEAFKPNFVQTLEHNLAVVHGGPFANIAHGCNSLVATNLALNISDYTVTEAGFASDLGLEKFFDIKTQVGNLNVDCVVIVTTIRSLKANGGVEVENLEKSNVNALIEGTKNLQHHCRIVKNFTNNFIVTLNKFNSDSNEEIIALKNWAEKNGIELVINDVWAKGGNGGINLAKKVLVKCENSQKNKHVYALNENVKTKIEKICKNIYGASHVEISNQAQNILNNLKKQDYYVCMAKTHMSLSDNEKLLNAPKDFTIYIKDVKVKEGANFVVCYTGNIITMPGLPKKSNATKIKIVEDVVEGIF